MKYTVSIEIALPREQVVQKFEATEIITRLEPADLREIPAESVVHYEREIAGKGMWNAARERPRCVHCHRRPGERVVRA